MGVQVRYASAMARVVVYVYVYVFLEWLFFATKPSFLGVWPFDLRLAGFWTGVLPFVGIALLTQLFCCLLDYAVPALRRREGQLLKVVPALVVVVTALMLVDNFTYTVFKFGVVDSTQWTIPIYWLFALAVFVWHVRRHPAPSRFRNFTAVALVLVSSGVLLWALIGSPRYLEGTARKDASKIRRPNIVMFASDGVNANHMSAYGYVRATTPNLDAQLNRALVADNAFTNASFTTGSLTSMMTGKYPATTKVMYPPYTLHGVDAYQSLPRILHQLGYVSIQETIRYYADGPDLNWREAFDEANGREVESSTIGEGHVIALQVPLQLDEALYKRVSDRVKHLLLIERMANLHAAVTSNQNGEAGSTSDAQRMQRVLAFIDAAQKPFFVHVHLLGTHCCSYNPTQKVFSAGGFTSANEKTEAQMDDAILQSDRFFGEMVSHLRERGLLDNTLIIYTSDHDNGWDFRSPVPLIFLFPSGQPKGHITHATQLLDVAPTVLDYLGLKIPRWMEGRSLLRGEPAPQRPIFSAYRLHLINKKGEAVHLSNMGPPRYGLSQMGMVVCQRWYVLDLDDGQLTKGAVADYKGSCPDQMLPDDAQARSMISKHLHQRGFVF